jgi:SAM-dependent methyltransferase
MEVGSNIGGRDLGRRNDGTAANRRIADLSCDSERRATADSTYGFDKSWSQEQRRLALIEQCYDPPTTARLDRLGVARGWRCLEIGAGNGSISHWLCNRVAPDGRVVAMDLNTRFLKDEPRIEVRQGDFLTEPVEQDFYDLVSCRATRVHHLREAINSASWESPREQLTVIIDSDFRTSHAVRSRIETVLHDDYELDHTTLQVDDTGQDRPAEHCVQPHGPVHHAP